MIQSALNFCERVFTACSNWLIQILNAIPGSADLILAGFFIFSVFTFFFLPLRGAGIGSGISDMVRRSKPAPKSVPSGRSYSPAFKAGKYSSSKGGSPSGKYFGKGKGYK